MLNPRRVGTLLTRANTSTICLFFSKFYSSAASAAAEEITVDLCASVSTDHFVETLGRPGIRGDRFLTVDYSIPSHITGVPAYLSDSRGSAAGDSIISVLNDCHSLARKRRLKELRKVLEQLVKQKGSYPAPELCKILCNKFTEWDGSNVVWDMLANVYTRYGMLHDAFLVITKMKEHKYQASTSTYNNLLYNLGETDIVFDLYKLWFEHFSPNKYTYNIVISGLCKNRRLTDAVTFLQEMKVRGFSPCKITFNTLISSFCNAGYISVANSFICLMLKFGIFPDIYIYNTLIHGFCVIGSYEEALKIFEDMESDGIVADVVTYNILIKGLRQFGLMDEVEKFLYMMLQKGLYPDGITYRILICGHCWKGNTEKGLQLQKEALSRGIQLNVVTYSILLSSLSKRGQFDEMKQLFYEMKGFSLKLDQRVYCIIINGYCKQGKIREALELFEEMLSKMVPNSFAYGEILSGLCKKRMVLQAKPYFDDFVNNESRVDIILYNIMIDGYVKIDKVRNAEVLYESIFKRQLAPTIVTFNSLLYGFCRTKEINMKNIECWLQKCEHDGLVPNIVTFTILIDACCRVNNFAILHSLLEKMHAKAVSPNVVTYTNLFIKRYCKQGRLQDALEVLVEMDKKGIHADTVTFNIIIQACCKERDLVKGLYFHDQMIQRNLEPNSATSKLLINGLCPKGNLKGTEFLLDTLMKGGDRFRKNVYTTVVKGDVFKLIVLFNKMVKMGFGIWVRE